MEPPPHRKGVERRHAAADHLLVYADGLAHRREQVIGERQILPRAKSLTCVTWLRWAGGRPARGLADLLGALQAGMRTVWLNGS
jgi:hypothetical protein